MPIFVRAALGFAGLSLLSAATFAFVPAEGEKQPGDAADAPRRPSAASPETGYVPPIEPASDEAARAVGSFRVPEGMTAELLAAEPMIANPVAFSIDDAGRYWVCETFRQKNAVVDNRDYGKWLLDDLAAQTVEDRAAYYKKWLGEKGLAEFAREHDRIRLLEDTTGDGKPDKATVFADGFNEPVAGTGAGVLRLGKDVYYTCIPHLWRLEDTDGDGRADVYEKLLSGFGVRVAFRGHDMHGLILGPDGRLYFSIGDRGFHVVTKEGKTLAMPDTGAVLRCEPDGSNLEVYAYGLRNPQELAFDDYGNLFTGDNNSDSGDKARWVYVAEGSDSGWRMYYQYLDDRGPWNREMMWYPADSPPLENEGPGGVPKGTVAKDVQPAYILPPVANLGDGPSGLVHYPGVGLPDRYAGHFFLCDFRGTPGNSGVRSFAVQPKGAGFELTDSHEFVWSILATDCDFAPNGRFVVSDWVNGWNGEGKGRLYGFTDAKRLSDDSAKLLAEDFSKRTPEQLLGLFSNVDRRVRQKAHLELGTRPVLAWPADAIQGRRDGAAIPYLHMVWATGLRAKSGDRDAFRLLSKACSESDPVVCAAAYKAFVEAIVSGPFGSDQALADRGLSPNVMKPFTGPLPLPGNGDARSDLRILHQIILGASRSGRAGGRSSTEERDWLFELLAGVAGDDPVLRQSVQTALADGHSAGSIRAAEKHPSPRVRLGAVVAMRRQASPTTAVFLTDADPSVVTEAARAINDVPIDAATPQLAAVASSNLTDPALRRVLNANFRLGTRENAARVAAVAADENTAAKLRVEAIKELRTWAEPPPLDRVTGMFRPVVKEGEQRDAAFMADVLRPALGGLLAGPEEVRTAAIDLAAHYGISEIGPTLRGILADAGRKESERVAALKGLAAVKADGLTELVKTTVGDASPAVRAEARTLWATLDPAAAVPVLDKAISDGTTAEKQSALAALATIGTPQADAVLARWGDTLIGGDMPGAVRLDILDALASRPTLKPIAEAYEAARPKDDPLAAWSDALEGGDVERGRGIFLNRTAVSCQRCHKAEGRGGEVGPELTAIGGKKDRHYLLEAIVLPNAKVAEGFESVVVVTAEGKVVTGVKRAETDDALTVVTADGQKLVIAKDDIEDRAVGKSAMPEDILKHLSPRDVRDLVEYLASLKEAGKSFE